MADKNPIRVFSISHSAVVDEYRTRHRLIAEYDDIDLRLLTPASWMQANQIVRAPRDSLDSVSIQPVCWGLKGHGLRNASHIYPRLGRIMEEFNPDILELWEEPFFAVTWQAIRAFKKSNPAGKVIFFSAQNIFRRYPPPFSWVEKFTYRNADLCFAMSSEVVDVIRQRGWCGLSVVLPLGIDMEKYSQFTPRQNSAIDGNEVVVGFVGRMDCEKGLGDLIDAVGILVGEGRRVRLLAAGGGPELELFRTRAYSKNISADFPGFIDPVKIPETIARMDVVVVPSRTTKKWKEQFGRVAVEAMGMGKPVVVSDSGELPVVADGAGLVFPEGNVEKLAEKVASLIDNPDLAGKCGRMGFEKASAEYDWRVIADKQVATYRQLMKSSCR